MTLKTSSEFGAAQSAGDVHLVFEFDGPDGIKYPQHQPGIDSYDEKQRVQVAPPPKSRIAQWGIN